MTIGVIKNYSMSCMVSLHKKVFWSLRFFLPLSPFLLVLLFYFFIMNNLRAEEDFISFFSICVMFACVCSFIFECITVALASYCFSLDVVVPDTPPKNDFTLDFKLFERLLGIVYVVFLIIFALASIDLSLLIG